MDPNEVSRAYLERLGFDRQRDIPTDVDSLVNLQDCHVRTVPFTNLSIHEGGETTPEAEATVPRIIDGGGGLCYDLNGAFGWLLEELGFDVDIIAARPMGEDGSLRPALDHLALIVNDHLVDVGFGDFARRPVPLDGEIREDVSGTYRVIERGDAFVAQSRADDEWHTEYQFQPVARSRDTFDERASYHSSAADAPFTGNLLATIPTNVGRVTLSGTSLTVSANGSRKKRTIPSAHVETVLRAQFGLEPNRR